jgi:hypothetical protein
MMMEMNRQPRDQGFNILLDTAINIHQIWINIGNNRARWAKVEKERSPA